MTETEAKHEEVASGFEPYGDHLVSGLVEYQDSLLKNVPKENKEKRAKLHKKYEAGLKFLKRFSEWKEIVDEQAA